MKLFSVFYLSAFVTFTGLGAAQSALATAADLSGTVEQQSAVDSVVAAPDALREETTDSASDRTESARTESDRTEATGTETAISEVLKLELHLSERRLAVYRGEMLIANYSVAVGREGWQTPTGEFSVFQKQQDPAWEHPFTGEVIPPGPGNPLGTRWIGFWSDGQNAIGFHGTPDESVIGSAVSHGCVRMRNEDVLALYEQVTVDTAVVVLP